MFIRKIIRTDGSESNLDGIRSITEIADMLFADSLHLVDLDDRIHIMLFNDEAYFLKLPINFKATEICNQKIAAETSHDTRRCGHHPESGFGA